ncbi:MAG TPA: YraN family protein [Candidatus Binataceae bacterium]
MRKPKEPMLARLGDQLSEWLAALRERLGSGERQPGWRQRLGRRGERIAERHLKLRGYRIVARNYRAAGAEIDIVAMDGATIVFVEVKMRRGSSAGTPVEAVDARKQARMRRAADSFAARYRAGERVMRFDVVAISAEQGRKRTVELLKDAF